eukprot:810300-Pleurochrysis_carterae.AAC.3
MLETCRAAPHSQLHVLNFRIHQRAVSQAAFTTQLYPISPLPPPYPCNWPSNAAHCTAHRFCSAAISCSCSRSADCSRCPKMLAYARNAQDNWVCTKVWNLSRPGVVTQGIGSTRGARQRTHSFTLTGFACMKRRQHQERPQLRACLPLNGFGLGASVWI